MATISTLAGPDGPLTHVTVALGRHRMPERTFYGCLEFMDGLTKEVPTWKTGRLKAAQPPADQMDDILRKWISGDEIKYGPMFKDLMPGRDEVWELKTADLRIFGWVYRPKVFVAALVGYADWYKPPNPTKSYNDAREKVLTARDALDLDPPKFATGVFDALV